MQRKQIYLSQDQVRSLSKLAVGEGENISALIRQAIDRFLEAEAKKTKNKKKGDEEFKKTLKRVAGIWKDRDPKEFEEIRRSWDRRLDEWGI